jgi:hypothetical protein
MRLDVVTPEELVTVLARDEFVPVHLNLEFELITGKVDSLI